DDDCVETTVLREHTLQDAVQIGRADAGVTDVAHVHAAGLQDVEAVRPVEQPLECSGPHGRLVQRVALDGAPARDQDPVQSQFVTAYFPTALPVRVDVEPHARLYFREDLGILPHLEPHPRRPDVVTAAPADPPTASQLGAEQEGRRGEPGDQDPGRHTRTRARKRGSHARTSTYGSLRYTKNTHVTANTTAIASPAPASAARPRTSSWSLNHSSRASTGNAPTRRAARRSGRTAPPKPPARRTLAGTRPPRTTHSGSPCRAR